MEYIKWRKYGSTFRWSWTWLGGRGTDTRWTNDVKQMKRLKALTTGQIVWRHFWTENCSGAISGSRISRSCIKGNCTKCQLSDDFHIYLICCNNTWGNLSVKNMSNLIEFSTKLQQGPFCWQKDLSGIDQSTKILLILHFYIWLRNVWKYFLGEQILVLWLMIFLAPNSPKHEPCRFWQNIHLDIASLHEWK